MKPGKDSARVRLKLIPTAALLVWVAVSLWPSVGRARQSTAPKRVLALYWYNKDYPGNVIFDRSFQAALESAPAGSVEYYPEYLDTKRFPGENQSQLLHEYLRQKYADRTIDVAVAVTDVALDFLLKYRDSLFPQTPIVFGAVRRPTTNELTAGPGLTGVTHVDTHRKTLDLALRLHPGTERVFIISGTLERDKRFETRAREELQGYESRVGITYLTDLPLDELIVKLKSLPQRSIVLYVWQQAQNEQGKVLESIEVLGLIAPSAPVPIYGMSSHNLGSGIVGGYLSITEARVTRIAEIALRVANGERAQDIPVESAPAVPMFDWRELQRWGISEDRLPPGSIVRFKEPTFWEQYKWHIIGVLTLIAFQASLIAVLLIERRRRQRAKEALDRLNAELEQRVRERTAALDAKSRELETFAYSVAHDLKAPLRGIDGYSRLLLEDHAGKLDDEGRSFLHTIHASTEEMGRLIEDLLDYSRLERREMIPDRLELRPLIAAVVEQKQHEAAGRGIDFVLEVNGGTAVADARGLTQALRNYLDNAIKFTRDAATPRIEVGAQENERRLPHLGARQWRRLRHEVPRPDLRDLPAPAPGRRVHGHRRRAGHRAQGGGAHGWAGLGRERAGPGRDVLSGDPK